MIQDRIEIRETFSFAVRIVSRFTQAQGNNTHTAFAYVVLTFKMRCASRLELTPHRNTKILLVMAMTMDDAPRKGGGGCSGRRHWNLMFRNQNLAHFDQVCSQLPGV